MKGLVDLAHDAIRTGDISKKVALISEMRSLCQSSSAVSLSHRESAALIDQPGMPSGLRLVHPRDLPRRSLQSIEGKAGFLHAIAHIEFNAINLALDAIYRFSEMPDEFYADWLLVAEQEADHHNRIAACLERMGYRYGDFPAHNGLWDMALKTANDLISRMAMVPCVFEARGLDVTPPMIDKLKRAGEIESAKVLQFILEEEIGHVRIGVRWYQYACRRAGLDPIDTFLSLLQKYLPNKKQGPFNLHHRREAGFSEEWLSKLEGLSG